MAGKGHGLGKQYRVFGGRVVDFALADFFFRGDLDPSCHPGEQIADHHYLPTAAASRGNPASIQRFSNGPQ